MEVEDLNKISSRIGKPTFDLMRGLIIKELDIINSSSNEMDTNLICNIVINTLTSLDINILFILKKIMEKDNSKKHNFENILNVYFQNIKNHFKKGKTN